MNTGSKKWIAIWLIFVMLFQMGLPITGTGAKTHPSFSDVSEHPMQASIEALQKQGLLFGYPDGTFRPDEAITRAEFSALLHRVFELSNHHEGDFFVDVQKNDWFYEDVRAVFHAGVFIGYPDGTFRPMQPITVQEAIVAIARLLKIPSVYMIDQRFLFTDDDEIASWARQSAYFLQSKQVLRRDGLGRLSPKNALTRGLSASFMVESLRAVREAAIAQTQQPPVQTEDVPVISSIMPQSGRLGSVVTIRGEFLKDDSTPIKVLFVGQKHGKMEAHVLHWESGELVVIAPGVVEETLSVQLVKNDLASNTVPFHMLGSSQGQESIGGQAKEFEESMRSLLQQTRHEIGIALSPFLPVYADETQQLEDEIDRVLYEMLDAIEEGFDTIFADADDLTMEMIEDLLSMELLSQQLEKIREAADILSRSSVTEALGNIRRAQNILREVNEILTGLVYSLNIARATAAAMSVAAFLSGETVTGTTLLNLANTLGTVVNQVLNPARYVVTGILMILDFAPTKAVEESLFFYGYQNDIGIDQYFASQRVVYSASWRTNPQRYYEQKVNRLDTGVALIKADMMNLFNPALSSEQAADDVMNTWSGLQIVELAEQALLLVQEIREQGTKEAFTNPIQTVRKLSQYADYVGQMEQYIRALNQEAKDKADTYASILLRQHTIFPDYAISMMPIENKMHRIQNHDAMNKTDLATEASAYYRIYTITTMLLTRTMQNMDFSYFDPINQGVEDIDAIVPAFRRVLVEDESLDLYYTMGLANDLFWTTYRLLTATEEQVQAIVQNENLWYLDAEDVGAIYITQPYFFKGSVDFTSRDNDFTRAETMLASVAGDMTGLLGMSDPLTGWLVSILVNMAVERLVDLVAVDLSDVPIALRVTFIDEDGSERTTSPYIDWEWIQGTQTIEGVTVSNTLMIKGMAPGQEKMRVVAVLDQQDVDFGVENIDAFSVVRNMRVISAYQEAEPFSMGPQLDRIVNITEIEEGQDGFLHEGYIGDILYMEGFGFSKNNQTVFFNPVDGYDTSGAAPIWMQYDNQYHIFSTYIPDAQTGDMWLSAGPNRGTREQWPSNAYAFTIHPPRIDRINPTAIIGEAWPVWGRGFSMTALHNTGNWVDDISSAVIKPPELLAAMDPFGLYDPVIDQLNHAAHVHLHRRLDFVVPDGAQSGNFHIDTLGVLQTEPQPVIVRSISTPVAVSSDQNRGLRPVIGKDIDQNRVLAIWIEHNDDFSNALIASVIQENGAMDDPVMITDRLGGLPTAPEVPGMSVGGGTFHVTWTGPGEHSDDVFFSISADGRHWSEPFNVSQSQTHSYQPSIRAFDMNANGLMDAIVLWREDDGLQSTVFARMMTNNGLGYDMGEQIKISQSAEGVYAYDPVVAIGPQSVAFSWIQDDDVFFKTIAYDQYGWGASEGPYNLTTSNWFGNAAPDLAYVPSQQAWAIVWEQYVETYQYRMHRRSDILYAFIDENGQIQAERNLTNSMQYSQSPKLSIDQDGVLAIAWIEQGYENDDRYREDPFAASIVFARSFDDGQEFHRPYLRIFETDNSTRLGHLSKIVGGSALFDFAWQADHNGQANIYMASTDRTIVPFEQPIQIEGSANTQTWMLMDQNGRWVIADENGQPIRSIPMTALNRDGAVPAGRYFDLSPDGIYMAAATPDGWVALAEADGAHPIGLYTAAHGESAYHMTEIYWSNDGTTIGSNFIDTGFVLFDHNGLRVWPYDDSARFDYVVFGNPWYERSVLVNQAYAFEGIAGMAVWDTEKLEKSTLLWDLGIIGHNHASFSPDGQKMAFLTYDDPGSYENGFGRLMIAQNIEGGGSTRALTDMQIAKNPVWNHDSGMIAFVGKIETTQTVMIVYPYRQSMDPVRLRDDLTDVERVVFAPQGDALYAKRQNGEVIKVSLPDGAATSVYGFPWTHTTVNRPTGGLIVMPEALSLPEATTIDVEVSLDRKPDKPVVVEACLDVTEGLLIETAVLVFDETDWNVPQTIRITALHDDIYTEDYERLIVWRVHSEDPVFHQTRVKGLYLWVENIDPKPDENAPRWENATLEIVDKGATWMEIRWSGAQSLDEHLTYHIYVDDVCVKKTRADIAIVHGLAPDMQVRIRIEAVDSDDRMSIDGPSVTDWTYEEERFSPGLLYDAEGMQKGAGVPAAYGYSGQLPYGTVLKEGLLWHAAYEKAHFSSAPVLDASGTIYHIAKPEHLTSFDVMAHDQNGALVWKKTLPDGFYSLSLPMQPAPFVTKDGNLLIVSANYLYQLDPNGDVMWQYLPHQGSAEPFMEADRWLPVSAAMDQNGVVYATAVNPTVNRLILYAVEQGQLLWRYESNIDAFATIVFLGSTYTMPIPLEDGAVLFGGEIIRTIGGQPIKTNDFPVDGTTMAAVGFDKVIRVVSPGALYGWDLKTGQTVFQTALNWTGEGIATAYDDTVYVGTEQGLQAIDGTGQSRWIYATDGVPIGAPVVDGNGNVIFVTDKNRMIALNDHGQLLMQVDVTLMHMLEGRVQKPLITSTGHLIVTGAYGLYKFGTEKNSAVSFQQEQQTAMRNDGFVDIILQRNADANGACIAYVSIDDTSSALRYIDYTLESHRIVFEPGETEAVLRINLLNNQDFDGNKKIHVNIDAVIGGQIDRFDKMTVDIIDARDYIHVAFAEQSMTVMENQGMVMVEVHATVGGSYQESYDVTWMTLSDTALVGLDYGTENDKRELSGMITFEPVTSIKTIEIPLIDDDIYRDDRAFFIHLDSRDPNVTIVKEYQTIQILIKDDETPSQFGFEKTSQTVQEDDGELHITVRRTGDTSTKASVDVSVNGDLSDPGIEQHIGKFDGALSFDPGQTEKTVKIDLIDDSMTADSVSLAIDLIGATGAVTDPTAFRTWITIRKKDVYVPPPVAQAGWEGGYGHIDVTDIIAPAIIRLYDESGIVIQQETAPVSTRRFNSVPVGNGYTVTQEVNGVESERSNAVDVIDPYVGEIEASSYGLEPGTIEGTKLTVEDRVATDQYYYIVTGDFIDRPFKDAEWASISDNTWQPIEQDVMDNIPVEIGQTIVIVQITTKEEVAIILGFSALYIGYEHIRVENG